MSSSKNRNLILSIHIDSAEINLAAGYVNDQEQVIVLALKRGELKGINFGNIINKDLFTQSLVENVRDFLDNHLRINSEAQAKSHKLQFVDGKLVIKKVAFNIIVSEMRKQDTIQTHLVQQILLDNFFDKDIVIGDQSNNTLFTCSPDTATTTLLTDDNNSSTKPYEILINLCNNSTWINFITDKDSSLVNSLSIQKGFKEVVDGVNYNLHLRQVLRPDDVYNGLKSFRFLLSRISVDIKVSLFKTNLNLSAIENSIVLRLQEIFHLCYDKFKELDRNGLRFKDDFLNKVQLNLVGYTADFLDVDAVAALVFSERLADEKDYLQQEQEKNAKITSNSQNTEQVIELATGTRYYKHANLPSLHVKNKEFIYCVDDEQVKFAHRSLRVQQAITIANDVCMSFTNFITDYRGQAKYLNYINNLDQFATTLGLILNFHLSAPKVKKTGVISWIMDLLKL